MVLMAGLKSEVYSEQVQRDMYASVVVAPIFRLSLDNANINFGYAQPGKSVELYPEKPYNEVKCMSNKGKAWYVKVSVIGNIIGPRESSVKPDSFKWMVARSKGTGIAEKGWHSFSSLPAQAYACSAEESVGEEVTIRFKYKLDLPPDAQGGIYSLNVLYTMTDIP